VLTSSTWQQPAAFTPEEIKWQQEHTPNLSEADLQPPPQHLQTQSQSQLQQQQQYQGETKLPGTVQTPSTGAASGSARFQRRSGVNPLEGLLGNDSLQLSEDELQQIEDEHTFVYSRTLTCHAPRSLLWRHLMKKIRNPELYTNARSCKILCEGPDFVYRDMLVGPPELKNLEDCISVRDKVSHNDTRVGAEQ